MRLTVRSSSVAPTAMCTPSRGTPHLPPRHGPSSAMTCGTPAASPEDGRAGPDRRHSARPVVSRQQRHAPLEATPEAHRGNHCQTIRRAASRATPGTPSRSLCPVKFPAAGHTHLPAVARTPRSVAFLTTEATLPQAECLSLPRIDLRALVGAGSGTHPGAIRGTTRGTTPTLAEPVLPCMPNGR